MTGVQTCALPISRIENAESEPGNWLAYGRTYEEQRFSPLTQINKASISKLGLAWVKDMGTNRAQESTPIIVDGIMFLTSSWSRVFAIDAVTGKTLWAFDPQVPGAYARKACCDVVNRGVAVYKGRVYVASLDGRLIALDAASGKKIWEVDTIIDRTRAYTITGAPRAAQGKIFIGNGGAEYGVRGYVTAYDAETGEQLTVNVSDPAFREAFDHDVTETRTTLEREFRKTGIDVIEISTDRPYADRLMRFFRQRAKRFR